MALSKRLRYEILRRDNHACRYCGGTAPDVALTVDHVVPTALGGSDDPSNLVAACKDCNSGKSSSTADAALVEDVAEEALIWRQLTEAAGAHLRAQREAEIEFTDYVITQWDDRCPTWRVPTDWQSSAARMYQAGVTQADVDYAIEATIYTRGVAYHWSYFCGVIWRQVKARDALAQQWLRDAKEGR